MTSFNHFVRAVDPLSDSFHAMDSGDMTREQVQELHNVAMDTKRDLRAAYDNYWKPPEDLEQLCRGWRQGPGYTKEHFSVFLHNLK